MAIVWPLFATFASFVLPTSYQFESFAALPLHFVSKVNYLEKVKMKHTKVKPRYLWACISDVIWFTDWTVWSKLVIVRNCNKGLEWNHCSTLSPKIQMISKNSLKWIVRDLQYYIKTRCLYTTADWYIGFVKNEWIFESFPRMKFFIF